MTGTVATALERVLQALAAARDDEVDEAVLGRQLGQLLATAAGHERDRGLGQPGRRDRLAGDGGEHGVGVRGAGRAAQHDRVARLQAQRGGVDRHVRPRLVDHGDHAERDAHPAHLQPVGQAAAVDHLADRVGQGDDLRARRRPSHARGSRRGAGGRAGRRRCRPPRPPPCRARWPRGSRRCAPRARRRWHATPGPCRRCRARRGRGRRSARRRRSRRRRKRRRPWAEPSCHCRQSDTRRAVFETVLSLLVGRITVNRCARSVPSPSSPACSRSSLPAWLSRRPSRASTRSPAPAPPGSPATGVLPPGRSSPRRPTSPSSAATRPT